MPFILSVFPYCLFRPPSSPSSSLTLSYYFLSCHPPSNMHVSNTAHQHRSLTLYDHSLRAFSPSCPRSLTVSHCRTLSRTMLAALIRSILTASYSMVVANPLVSYRPPRPPGQPPEVLAGVQLEPPSQQVHWLARRNGSMGSRHGFLEGIAAAPLKVKVWHFPRSNKLACSHTCHTSPPVTDRIREGTPSDESPYGPRTRPQMHYPM